MSFRQMLYIPFQATGIDIRRFLCSFCGVWRYLVQCQQFWRMGRHSMPVSFCAPCTTDWYESCGNTCSPYFAQDLWVAQKIFESRPSRHIDVGSRIDGFIAHVASFRVVEEIDIRPSPMQIKNVVFRQADFMKILPPDLVECCDSASCLHALEHFGLGRYGDPLNPNGHLIGLDNLWRLLKRGGKLYLSVPIGRTRVEFNSQRVFSVEYILNMLADRFSLVGFSYIDDNCIFHEDVKVTKESAASSFECKCGCGIFLLVKK